MDFVMLEEHLKVLSDKMRLNILKLIIDGQHCGCELIDHLSIKQPTLSHHLKVLSQAGFIVGVRDKKKIHYLVNEQKIKWLKDQFDDLLFSDKTCKGDLT
jgi:ArsR family transcriptional regulator